MTSGTEVRNSHVQLVQYNKQLQCLLSQMKQKTELYELGLGNISKILKDLPNELQFKVLTSADRLRSSFSLTAHLLMQKKALDKIEKVVGEVQSTISYKGIFAGLAASCNSNNKNQHTTAQPKTSEAVQVNSQPSIIVATTRANTESQPPIPTTSTLSIQKSLIKPMPPAPPPPSITKHTVSPAVVHNVGCDSKEIQIQIEANPIDKHAFLEKDFIFRGATIRNIGKHPKMDFDHNNIFIRRGRGRPPTRIPGYATSKVLRDPRRFPRRAEEQYHLNEGAGVSREEDMAWQCLERVYASHRAIVKDKHFSSGGSFNISQILENAPIAFSNTDNDAHHSRFPRPQSISPSSGKHGS